MKRLTFTQALTVLDNGLCELEGKANKETPYFLPKAHSLGRERDECANIGQHDQHGDGRPMWLRGQ